MDWCITRDCRQNIFHITHYCVTNDTGHGSKLLIYCDLSLIGKLLVLAIWHEGRNSISEIKFWNHMYGLLPKGCNNCLFRFPCSQWSLTCNGLQLLNKSVPNLEYVFITSVYINGMQMLIHALAWMLLYLIHNWIWDNDVWLRPTVTVWIAITNPC